MTEVKHMTPDVFGVSRDLPITYVERDKFEAITEERLPGIAPDKSKPGPRRRGAKNQS
jgi:hypothetical protein